MRRHLRAAAWVGAIACATASCGWALPEPEDDDATPAPTATSEATQASAAPGGPATPEPTVSAPLFTLRLVDLNGLRPKGIPVRVTGPRDETLLTDGAGEVKIFEPPGTYELRVVKGCGDHVEVHDGGWARVTLPPGQSHAEEVQVDWRHRIAPAGPAIMNTTRGNWSIGMQVDLRYPVQDRCKGNELVPGASYPTYELRPSDSIEVVGEVVFRAGDDGHGRVSVRCKAPGDVRLFSEDKENPKDSTNLLPATLEGRRPRCGDFGEERPPTG